MIQFAPPLGNGSKWSLVKEILHALILCVMVSSWSTSLSDTVKEGIIFESDELTTTVSTSVSNTISSSYSQSATKSCSASCTVGPNGEAFLWQWQMVTEEVNYQNPDDVMVPFTTFACNYICTNSTEAPKCPPGYCSDSSCQTCTTDIYNGEKKQDTIESIVSKVAGDKSIITLIPENVEPELRKELIEKYDFIPIESLNLPQSILDRMPLFKPAP
eukprot:CAMPEP_0117003068 /NCGR_PEP_ID=MMETSP0472-20121206/4512_1 /TAXON_ID=693140 ORGANISM="Tiarina fusus, Strain LIS" /NCGR_SAMPLE_ID=MMETSP0472 /ASSEMBLY_ACC=CAM_ASM_000603 /LENGTH=215 /DNA_ID=CAMNT_0004703595 /DNA_START=718 /DNA_END=1366 /DNA_ORIENTATION=-